MNERIKELDKQAYQWAVNESKGGPNICAPGSDYFLAIEKKKFAELIVKECVDIAYAYDAPKMSGPGMIVANRIEDHFGVEE